jgi:hypothetical protein
LGYYFNHLYERFSVENIVPTAAQAQEVHDYIAQAKQFGLQNVPTTPVVQEVYDDLIQAHAQSYQFTFYVSAALALVGAVASFALVRKALVSGPTTLAGDNDVTRPEAHFADPATQRQIPMTCAAAAPASATPAVPSSATAPSWPSPITATPTTAATSAGPSGWTSAWSRHGSRRSAP